MSDNVLIFGAGVSADAGIPMLPGFMEKMWEFSIRKAQGEVSLSDQDCEVFGKAMSIRRELDGYHGRSAFDDRNIEDVLSILSFNVMCGSRSDKKNMDWILKAINRTIELTCKVHHNGELRTKQTNKSQVYRRFWYNLFAATKKSGKLPTIITFNYDLVLERSLMELLVNTFYNFLDKRFPYQGVTLKYYFDGRSDVSYKLEKAMYSDSDYSSGQGTILNQINSDVPNFIDIELLKLHGSLNFPNKRKLNELPSPITIPVERPYILPPIFNKLNVSEAKQMWSVALERLRNAKHLTIVGYSLPETDIYMQYFLKTALGPNLDLNRIFIFNPVLFRGGKEAEKMKARYESCFSPQLRSRIEFFPAKDNVHIYPEVKGSFEHFVRVIEDPINGILF